MTSPVESAPPSGSRALLRKLGEGDLFLLRWALLGVIAPGCVVALQLTDFFERCDEQQLRILAGHPFYISAEDVQVTLLSPPVTFAICVGIALYLGAVLLRCRSYARRSHICLLAAVAIAMPGLLCVLWHGVLYVGQPLTCLAALWLLLVPCSFVEKFFS